MIGSRMRRPALIASPAVLAAMLAAPAVAQPIVATPPTSDTRATSAPSVSTPEGDAPNQSPPGQSPITPTRATLPPGTRLEEVVVTAQKRSQRLQKVPISVVAIKGADLAQRGVHRVVDLGGSVPGLTIQQYNGVLQPFLRGIGNSGSAAGNESSVAVYIDGVYFVRLVSSFLDLADVDRVEVLKGPQGTLFGRNSTGGVINVVTRDPSFDPRVSGSFGYGRFNQVQGDVYATTRITDQIAASFSFSGSTNDGYGKNLTTGDRYGYNDSILARGKLLYQPTDDTKIVFSGFYSYSLAPGERGAYPGTRSSSISQPPFSYTNSDIGFYNTNAAFNPRDEFKIFGGSVRVEQNLSFAKLVSISAYTQSHEFTVLNGLSSPRPDEEVVLRGPINLFTQEVQLVNKPGAPFDWITGLYYYNNYTAYTNTVFYGPLVFGPAGGQAPAYQRAFSYAGFGQATYELLPKLKLTGGIRYTSDVTTAHGSFFLNTTPRLVIQDLSPSTTHITRVTFKAAADYQLTRDILAYFSFSRGFKSGNYNIITYNSTTPTKPEGIDAYEVGFKSELLNHRLRLNGALFNYDVKNPQVEQIEQGSIIYSNAGASRSRGGELEAQAAVYPGLTARASFTYLDAHYTNYPNAPTSIPNFVTGGALPAPDIDAAGNTTPNSPKETVDVGADYTFDTPIGKMTTTADFYHNTGYTFEPDNFLRQRSYSLVSAAIKDQITPHLGFRVYGTNLNGAHYEEAGQTQIGLAGYLTLPAPPAFYGFAFDFSY